MEVIYTRHAKSRMRWREISKEEVKKALEAPERREFIDSNRLHYFRQFGKRNIRITCAIEGQKCIVNSVVDKSD